MKLINIIAVIFTTFLIMMACGKNMASFTGEERTLDQRGQLTNSMDAEGIPLATPDVAKPVETQTQAPVTKSFADTMLVCDRIDEAPTYGCVLKYKDGTKYEGVISKWLSVLSVEEQQGQGAIEVIDAPKDSKYYVFVKPGPSITNLKFETTADNEPKPKNVEVKIENTQPVVNNENNNAARLTDGDQVHFVRISNAGQSCVDACEGHGGYDEATRMLIGSDANDSIYCSAALAQFSNKIGFVTGDSACTVGLGCYIGADQKPKRCKATKTTEDAFLAGVQRVCLCNAE